MPVNKVVFGAVSIMDITDSTVTPEKLVQGETAYDRTGEKINGTNPYEKVATDSEIDLQAQKIAQLSALLEGKALGGGGGGSAMETGTLYGSTSRLGAPGSQTYYFNLNAIPDLGSKNFILVSFPGDFSATDPHVILYRVNTSYEFCVKATNEGDSLGSPTIGDNVLSISGNGDLSSMIYYAK